MNIYYIGLIITALLSFITLHLLDKWSTFTLLKYTDRMVSDEEFRKKIYQTYKNEDVLKDEMNPLPRFFFRKFGIKKGMFFMDLFFFIPFTSYVAVGMFSGWIYPMIFMNVVWLFLGILLGQIIRAFHVKNILKQNNLSLEVETI